VFLRRSVSSLHGESETNARNGCAHHTLLSETEKDGPIMKTTQALIAALAMGMAASADGLDAARL